MYIGTNHFRSRNAAIRYFEPYGYEAADIDLKIAEHEIEIGEPPLKAGEKLLLADSHTRYVIETSEG